MNQTTSSLSLDRKSESDLFDSIRHDLLVMELNKLDRSDIIIQKLEQVKEYSIYEA